MKSRKKAIDAAYWLCPECAPSLKPTWVKIGDESSDRNEVAPVTLNKLSEMMTKLVQEVAPTLVEEALDKSSVNITERNRKLETEIVDTEYHWVLKESSERQKRRCNIIIKGSEALQTL